MVLIDVVLVQRAEVSQKDCAIGITDIRERELRFNALNVKEVSAPNVKEARTLPGPVLSRGDIDLSDHGAGCGIGPHRSL